LIEVLQIPLLNPAAHTGRWDQVGNPRLTGPDHGALVERWQPPTRPVVDAQNGQPTRIGENAIRRQVLALGAERIGDPGAQYRPACCRPPGIERVDRLTVVVDSGLHRTDQRDVVGDRAQGREELAELHAALASLVELPRAGKEPGAGLAGIVVLDVAD